MHAMPMRGAGTARRQARARRAVAMIALALSGCASSIQTPLPDLPRTPAATSMSQQDHQKAVDELEKAGATHEHEAEQQIESSR